MATEIAVQGDGFSGLPSGWEQGSATAGALTPSQGGAIASVAREEAELKGAIVVAKHFPRDELASHARLMRSLERPRLAEDCTYSFPRGGSTISGPSVDLAREIARCWGNMRYGLRMVTVDEDYVHIRGFALDLESNSYVEAEDKFAKLIQRKRKGETQWVQPDERDLRELVNRRGAILVRNCILQLLPPDVVDEAQEKAQETLRAAAAGKLDRNREDTTRRMVSSFEALGVSSAMLAERLGHKLALISADELAEMTAIYKSIRDGQSRREEYFAFDPPQRERVADLSDRVRRAAASELDGVGLTANGAAAREPLPAEPLEPAKDPVILLGEKAFEDPSGKGKAASDPQRERIREIAGVIAPTLDESDPLAERLLHMAAQNGLSTGHAGSLISLGKDAVAHLELELPSEREETVDSEQGALAEEL